MLSTTHPNTREKKLIQRQGEIKFTLGSLKYRGGDVEEEIQCSRVSRIGKSLQGVNFPQLPQGNKIN